MHRESNPTDEPSIAVIARAGGGLPTVNVDPPDTGRHRSASPRLALAVATAGLGLSVLSPRS